MKILKKLSLAAATGACALMVSGASVQVAEAQTLFDLLFKKRQQAQRQAPPAPVEIKKVSAPKYYGYRMNALKRVKFAPLVALTKNAAAVDNTQTGVIDGENAQQQASEPVVFENQDFLDGAATLGEFKVLADKATGKAVVDHYLANPEFYWLENGKPRFSTELVMDLMAKANEIGLEAADYAVELPSEEADAAELIRFEMKMSLMAVRYALDARNGKINPNRLSGYHDFPKVKYNAAQAIKELTEAVSPSSYLADATPNSEKFQKLRAQLQQLKHESADIITIKAGTLIKPGKSHEELPNVIAAIRKKGSTQLLQRHGEALTTYSRTPEFTEGLVALVKDFQKEVKLKPDGIVGRNTISRLVDIAPQEKMNRVKLAMERLRWHPRQFGKRHVFINQPAYRARYIENHEEKLSMRVIVGKRSNQTTFFHDTIERVEYNPYWGVPQSIIINEMLPNLRADPGYLDKRGYEVTTQSGRKISSSSVDWYSVGGGVVPYNVRQYPGKKNALGELKILFPNKHAIYMHDTPSRGLFKRERRALSHGCIRLQDPRGMAAAVLGTTVSHVASRINTGKNNGEELKQRIPVYVAYFTAWPNKDGEVEYFTDIYGRDKHLTKAMEKVTAARGKSV